MLGLHVECSKQGSVPDLRPGVASAALKTAWFLIYFIIHLTGNLFPPLALQGRNTRIVMNGTYSHKMHLNILDLTGH